MYIHKIDERKTQCITLLLKEIYLTFNCSVSVTDLSTTFANYLPINPTQKTALNTNYMIKQSQITDLAPVDMSNYLPLNPTTQITLSSKYLVRNWSLINDSITGERLAPKTITADRIANQTITASQTANNTITASQIANHTITNLQIAAYTITNSEIAQNTIFLQNLYYDLVTLIVQQRIYVRYIMESGKLFYIDQTGSVCQFSQQLTMEYGTQIGTAQCYTGFGGYIFTGNSNVNNLNWQQSPSSSKQLDTSKPLNNPGSYGMLLTIYIIIYHFLWVLWVNNLGLLDVVIFDVILHQIQAHHIIFLILPMMALITVIPIKIKNKIFQRKEIINNNQIKFQNLILLHILMIQIKQKESKNQKKFYKMKIQPMKKEKKFKMIFFQYKLSNLKHNKVSPIKTSKIVNLITFQIINR